MFNKTYKPYNIHCTTYDETLNAVSLENKIIDFCKPIYIGFAVLEMSKTKGDVLTHFLALRAKSFTYKINGRKKLRAKGIRGHVVKNHMNFNDHYRCLFGDTTLDPMTENVSIRSFKHQLKTIKSSKLTYNSFDDKRVILEDKLHTLSHGHYSLEETETLDQAEASSGNRAQHLVLM